VRIVRDFISVTGVTCQNRARGVMNLAVTRAETLPMVGAENIWIYRGAGAGAAGCHRQLSGPSVPCQAPQGYTRGGICC